MSMHDDKMTEVYKSSIYPAFGVLGKERCFRGKQGGAYVVDALGTRFVLLGFVNGF